MSIFFKLNDNKTVGLNDSRELLSLIKAIYDQIQFIEISGLVKNRTIRLTCSYYDRKTEEQE